VSVICSNGCQSAAIRRADSLEARLRDKQARIDELAASLEQVETDRNVARREASILRDELGKLQPSPEIIQAAHTASRIDRIEVVSLLSGALDRDDIPGDEQISLLIAPEDSNGEIHRVSGELSVRLTDISLPAGSEEIATATFDEAETDALWHNGIVGRGFRVLIPLPANLKTRTLTAHIRFNTNTGSQFDTLHQLSVSPEAVTASVE
tara:strand:+ start:52662 stop:53288 length:627 start_codon:yes stop_codon:yes gene_type:complete